MTLRLLQTGTRTCGQDELTGAQQRFAARVDAEPGMWSEDAVILYRKEFGVTHRWIVDCDGNVVDEQCFHEGPKFALGPPV
jgi:hypothetical protein